MTLTEEIVQHIQTLPEALKAEVLDFVEFLEVKNRKGTEDSDWATLSLSSALRGMEDEPQQYALDDVKERFA